MTDTTIPSAELAEADIRETAERLGFDPSDVRELLAALNVPMQAAPKPLPTEPGAVIIATEVRGVKGRWRSFLAPGGQWATSERVDGYVWHYPDQVTAWTPARVVSATAAPVTLTEDQVGQEWNRHKTEYMSQWKDNPQIGRTIWTITVNALLAKHAAPRG